MIQSHNDIQKLLLYLYEIKWNVTVYSLHCYKVLTTFSVILLQKLSKLFNDDADLSSMELIYQEETIYMTIGSDESCELLEAIKVHQLNQIVESCSGSDVPVSTSTSEDHTNYNLGESNRKDTMKLTKKRYHCKKTPCKYSSKSTGNLSTYTKSVHHHRKVTCHICNKTFSAIYDIWKSM